MNIYEINLVLTNNGKRIGWDKLGKCELGDVRYVRRRDASLLPYSELLQKYYSKWWSYSTNFVPPGRKRSINMSFYFNKCGVCSGIEINYGRGYFSKRQCKEWVDILKNWMIQNGYAEEIEREVTI